MSGLLLLIAIAGAVTEGPRLSPADLASAAQSASCPTNSNGEIVVCARSKEGESPYRLPRISDQTNAGGMLDTRIGKIGVRGGGPKKSTGVTLALPF